MHLSFIAQALRGKKVGLQKVIGFIDKLVGTLQTEQDDDDTKKGYCEQKLDETEDKKKTLERTLADVKTVIDEGKEKVQTLTGEIKDLKAGIVTLDKQVAKSTAQREEERATFEKLRQSDNAAKELLLVARN